MSGQYTHPFSQASIILEVLLVTCSAPCYLLNPQLLTGFTSEQSHPKKTNSAFEKHLNGSGLCLKLHLLLVFSCLHGTVYWKKLKFTLDILT